MISLKIPAFLLFLSLCLMSDAQTFDTSSATISTVLNAIQTKSITCVNLIARYIARIKAYNGAISAVIYTNEARALLRALQLDNILNTNGSIIGPLHCVPLLVKDNYDISGLPTTNGASAMNVMIPSIDSDAVKKLTDAGAIVIGKANMALTSDSGEYSISQTGGTCKNPFGQDRTCYGSSGGTGAGLAADFAVIGLGTDTEGSVVAPASAGNAFGLRTTQITNGGSVSLNGVYPAFQRQDAVGPMARAAEDVIKMHEVLLGTNRSSTLMNANGMQGIKVTYVWQLLDTITMNISNINVTYKTDTSTKKLILQFISNLQSQGVILTNLTLPEDQIPALAQEIFYTSAQKANCSGSCIITSVNGYLSRTGAYPNGPFKNATDLLNTTMPADYLTKLNNGLQVNSTYACTDVPGACQDYMTARTVLAQRFTNILNGSDFLIAPTFPTMPHLNSATLSIPDKISIVYPFYTGDPALDIPIGFSDPVTNSIQGLPIGIVVQAKKENIDKLLSFGYAYGLKYPNRQAVLSMPQINNNAKTIFENKVIVVLLVFLIAHLNL